MPNRKFVVPSSGINDPPHAARPRFVGPLLAQDSIGGPINAEDLHHLGLRFPVHIGDHVGGRRLGLHAAGGMADAVSQDGRGRLSSAEGAPGQLGQERIRMGGRGSEGNRGFQGCEQGPSPRWIVVSHPPVVAYVGRVLVDLRSDTVTRPRSEMRRAMAEAEVGDDESGEDPTVNLLQETFAALTGKDAALFVPSGTMANQVALRTLTRPGDAVVAGSRQHVVVYEQGAVPINAGITFLMVADSGGLLAPTTDERKIVSGSHQQPKLTLLAVEDTHMASGARRGRRDEWPSWPRWPAAMASPYTWMGHASGMPRLPPGRR